MTQFPDAEVSLYSFFNYDKFFSSNLLFLVQKPTKVSFLADTGNIVNIIVTRVLRKFYPKAWENRQPYGMSLSGVGGAAKITRVVWIPLGNSEPVPFFTGPEFPKNLVGYTYLQSVSSSLDIRVSDKFIGASSDKFIGGLKKKVRVGSGTLEEFGLRVGAHHGSVLSPLIFAIADDVVTEYASEGLIY